MMDNIKEPDTTLPKEKRPRIGLFGGTFNPVHLAHIQVSSDIQNRFKLDKILVIPSAIPPHKVSSDIISAKDRLQMVNFSFNNFPAFEVSDIELRREGPSFTIDTVRQIQSDYSNNIDLFLIIGSDAFFELHTWHEFESLFDTVEIIVMTRPGSNIKTDKLKEENAGGYLRTYLSTGYKWVMSEKWFSHNTKKTISFFDVTRLDISSTRIRKYIKENNCNSTGFLHNKVADYITKKGLYK